MLFLSLLLFTLVPQLHSEGISEDFKALMKKHFPDSKVLDEVMVAMKKRIEERKRAANNNSSLSANDYPPIYGQHTMDEMSNFFADLMHCSYGWCSYHCCDVPSARPIRPSLEYIGTPSMPDYATPLSPMAKTFSQQPKPIRKLSHRIVTTTAMARPIVAKYPPQQRQLRPTFPTLVAAPVSMGPPRKRPAVACPKACQPNCNQSCLKRYNEIVYDFMNSLTQTDVMGIPDRTRRPPDNYRPIGNGAFEWNNNNNIEEEWNGENQQPWLPQMPSDEDRPVCRADCMPLCLEGCIVGDQRAICRPTCMPACSQACLESPPLMVPCTDFDRCFCPAGYVQCSETTCCMKYRAMAVRYKNKFASYRFSDDKDIEPGNGGNQTSVYLNALRRLGGTLEKPENTTVINVEADSETKQLPNNATIVFYPEQKKAEIVMNDGAVLTEIID